MSSERINQSFLEMDAVAEMTAVRRAALIDILQEAINKIALDFKGDSARTVEVKLAAIKTMDDLCKSQESLTMAKVKLALSSIDTEANKNISDVAVEVLKRIDMTSNQRFNGPSPSAQSIEDNSILERVALDSGITIEKDELSSAYVQPGVSPKINEKEFAIEEE